MNLNPFGRIIYLHVVFYENMCLALLHSQTAKSRFLGYAPLANETTQAPGRCALPKNVQTICQIVWRGLTIWQPLFVCQPVCQIVFCLPNYMPNTLYLAKYFGSLILFAKHVSVSQTVWKNIKYFSNYLIIVSANSKPSPYYLTYCLNIFSVVLLRDSQSVQSTIAPTTMLYGAMHTNKSPALSDAGKRDVT